MKGDIESITRALDETQICLFKDHKCQYCTNINIFGICAFFEKNVSFTMIKCIEEDFFRVRIEILRSE